MPFEEIIEVFYDRFDEDAFYAKVPYNYLNRVHRIGGKWNQSKKQWRFPLDEEIWQHFSHEFRDMTIKKSPLFILAMQHRKSKLSKFLTAKEIAEKDEPTDFGVEGVSLDGKNCLFNYQRHGVKCGLDVGDGFLIGDVMGLGKGQPYDEIVYTPFGKTEIGKLKVGDFVIGKNGVKTKVIGTYPQGIRNVYKITFSDGTSVNCDENHLWNVAYPTVNSKDDKWHTFNVKQLIDKNGIVQINGSGRNQNKAYHISTYYKKKNGNNAWKIPICEPIQFDENEKKLPIEPYLLGLLIGDAQVREKHAKITLGSCDFDELFSKYISENQFKAKELHCSKETERSISFCFNNELLILGIGGCRSWEKFIPECYKYSSVENRLALLQGLMDTDGHCIKSSKNRKNKNNFNCTEYCTVSERLAFDVIELVQTLGGIARLHCKIGKYKKDDIVHVCRKAYRINIKMPMQFNPFRLKRKANIYNAPQKYEVSRYIKNIECIGEKETICIKVDSQDELYLTRNCIVTHNTIQSIGIAVERKNRGEIHNCLIVCPASLKYNWLDEIHKFTKETALVIGHKAKSKEDREKQWIAEGYFFKIVNYELVARDLYADPKHTDNRISCSSQVLKSFDMVSFDEIQYLKHHASIRTMACRELKCKYRVGLSGTPLDGKLEEIHSIFQILKPGLFVNKKQFLARYAEFDWFGKVIGYHKINEVREKIAPYYLRRLKENVLKELPPKLFKDMHVELSAKNMKDYQKLVSGKAKITEEAAAAVMLVRARQFLDFPELVGMHNSSDKYAVFKELVDELVTENNQKVIVFTQFTSTIDLLVKNLTADGYKNIQVIDGSVDSEERQNICKKFNSEDKYHILIMSDAGCTGLNLQSAHAVIHYTDNYSPAVMQQRNDRAHRATTKHSVMIYRFIVDETIDEHVRSVLSKKMSVNNALLSEDCNEFSTGRMTSLELLSCL